MKHFPFPAVLAKRCLIEKRVIYEYTSKARNGVELLISTVRSTRYYYGSGTTLVLRAILHLCHHDTDECQLLITKANVFINIV